MQDGCVCGKRRVGPEWGTPPWRVGSAGIARRGISGMEEKGNPPKGKEGGGPGAQRGGGARARGGQVRRLRGREIAGPGDLGCWGGRGVYRENPKRRGGGTIKRSTKTIEERLEAVLACLEGGRALQEVAQAHQVAVQTLRSWVKKYQELGPAGLEDRRGKRLADQTPRSRMRPCGSRTPG